jgi:hypothetical protein
MGDLFDSYVLGDAWDEMFESASGSSTPTVVVEVTRRG